MYFGYGSTDTVYILLLLVVMGISLFAQSRVQKTFNKYAETPIASGMRAETRMKGMACATSWRTVAAVPGLTVLSGSSNVPSISEKMILGKFLIASI